MTLSEHTKPALTAVFLVALAAGWYWFEHRSPPEEKETQTDALVIRTKAVAAGSSPRAGARSRRGGPDRRRRPGLTAGRADVPHRRQQRARTGCRGPRLQ